MLDLEGEHSARYQASSGDSSRSSTVHLSRALFHRGKSGLVCSFEQSGHANQCLEAPAGGCAATCCARSLFLSKPSTSFPGDSQSCRVCGDDRSAGSRVASHRYPFGKLASCPSIPASFFPSPAKPVILDCTAGRCSRGRSISASHRFDIEPSHPALPASVNPRLPLILP